jgi:thiol-disulfide isomerase/thioredoxin
MAATSSNMLPLGTTLPPFDLTDAITGLSVSDKTVSSQGALVMFICNHCPFVIHIRPQLGKLANSAVARGLSVYAINANSIRTHPQDGPPNMKKLAVEEDWRFPFLFDDTQEVAKRFRAACTPDFYLFNGERKLVYRGQFDDSRPSNGKPVTGADLQAAIDAVLDGHPVPETQRPSIGCNIKWHPEGSR